MTSRSSEIILNYKFAGKHFFKWIKNRKKNSEFQPKLSNNGLFVTFAVSPVDVSNKNDCKLAKNQPNFQKEHFLKNPMVFLIFETENCASIPSFSPLLYIIDLQ